MEVALGPLPAGLHDHIRGWVASDRWADPAATPWPDAVMICGGPASCTLLAPDGEVYCWCPWDDTITLIADGPRKVLEDEKGTRLVYFFRGRPRGRIVDCRPRRLAVFCCHSGLPKGLLRRTA